MEREIQIIISYYKNSTANTNLAVHGKNRKALPTGSQRRKPTLTLSFSELEQLLGKSAHTVTGKN